MDIKVREGQETTESSAPPVSSRMPGSTKRDRHEELRKRGEEKRKLLAALNPQKSMNQQSSTAPTSSMFRLDGAGETMPKAPMTLIKRKDEKGFVPLFKQPDVVRTTLDISKPDVPTKHSEHKRKKMREREKAKREKLRLKKEDKAEKRTKRIDNKPKFKEVIDRPSESIREMGMMLAQKLAKESKSMHAAYDSIGKNRKVDN
jgi:hypothetical protein